MEWGTNITVLHVDDDADFAEMVAGFLEREDDRIETITATSGPQALDLLTERDVDCVISDYDMPAMDGLELLEEVRQDDDTLPFILFTGQGSETVASRAFSAGATDYLQKQPGTDQYTILANRVTKYVERARAQRQRDRQLKAIETAHEGISILNEDGKFVYVNDAYAELYGYDPDEMLGEHWELIYPEDEVAYAQEEILPTVQETGDWEGETMGLRADGSTFIEDHTVSRTDAGDLVCTVVDVTEWKQRRDERDRYRAIVEALDDPVYVIDNDGRFVYVNETFVDRFGYESETVIGATPDLIKDDEAVAAAEDHLGRLLSDDGPDHLTFEVDIHSKDGDRIRCEDHMGVLPYEGEQFRGSVGILRDITDKKEAMAELEQYRHIVDEMDQAACLYDAEGRFVTVNEYLAEWYGTTKADLEGQQSSLVEWLRADRNDDPFASLVAGERDAVTGELTDDFPGHGHATIAYRLSRLVVDGTFRGVVAVARDITDRRRREQAIEQLHQATRELFAADSKQEVTDCIAETVRDILGYPSNVVRLVNTEGTQLRPVAVTGPAEEMLGKRPVYDVGEGTAGRAFEQGETMVYEDVQTINDEHDRGGARAGLYVPIGEQGTISINDTEQDVFDETDIQLAELLAANANAALNRVDRATQLRRQRNRFEEFTNIISHDLRNPLNIAEGQLALAQAECDTSHLDDVESALSRMETLIDDLLTYAREGESVNHPEELDLAALAQRCWETSIDGDATLRVTTDRTIRGDASRVRELLENLFRNSIEHTDGSVTVTVGDLENGFYVADDGPGIPDDERESIFDHGYSTADRGTGFGLAIVQQIADAHGWEITVTDGMIGGVRFEIRTE